jgi:hypothetical protein
MYSTSNLFRKAYAHCTKQYDKVVILSAKYGLLFPDEEIEPYNVTLRDASVDQVRKWSDKVFEQMKSRIDLKDFGKVYFHAGKKYRQYLIPKLEKEGLKCEDPLEDLRIGRQLAWYKEHDCQPASLYWFQSEVK